MKRRWYDSHNETIKTLTLLRNLDEETTQSLSDNIVDIANQIKNIHKEEEEPALSIGLDRVLGLYQSSNSRRWYDKDKNLACAIQTISTLPEEDFRNIMEGLSLSLKD